MAMQLIALLLLAGHYWNFGNDNFPTEWLRVSPMTHSVLFFIFQLLFNIVQLGMAMWILGSKQWRAAGFAFSFYPLILILVFAQYFLFENFIYDPDHYPNQLDSLFDFWTIFSRIGLATFWLVPMLLVALMMRGDGLRLKRYSASLK